MTSHAHATPHAHAHPSYVKIWGILVMLLCISVAGPMLGHKVVTLITAFGIAIVKAYLVAKHFMHITIEKRFIPYIILTMLVFMLLFFAGTSPDVMKKDGTQWEKPSWKVAPAAQAPAAHEGAQH